MTEYKFNRQYSFKFFDNIALNSQGIEITNPIDIKVDIENDIEAQELSTATFEIFGLSEQTKDKMYRDETEIVNFNTKVVSFSFNYGQQPLIEIFKGNIFKAYSLSSGTDNSIKILCQNGKFLSNNYIVNFTLDRGYSDADLFKKIILDSKMASQVSIAPVYQTNIYNTPITVYGNPIDYLKDRFADSFYIANNKAFLYPKKTVNQEIVFHIKYDSNLLPNPIKNNLYLELDILLEPTINIGQAVQIESKYSPKINGFYKVMAIKHNIEILTSSAGSSKTTLRLYQI